MNWFKRLFGKNTPTPPNTPEYLKTRGGTLTLTPVKLESAQSEWQRRKGTTPGFTVILVNPLDHIEVKEDAHDESPSETLDQAAAVDLPKFFADRHESLALDEEEEENEEWESDHQEPDPAKLVRAKNPVRDFVAPTFAKSAYLAEIPCQAPWQVLAHFPFGGWNDCPYDHELTAVFKDWYERFGAVPALISSDMIEFWLDKPIEDPAVAAKLAMEMYILCPDAVDQGTESTEALANAILGANVWSFWWD